MTFTYLETGRSRLKLITPGILHELYDTCSKEEVMLTLGFDEAAYMRHLEMHQKGMETHRISMRFFLLVERSTGRTIGSCGYHTWNATHRRAELFYALFSDEDKQKGMMKEALGAVLEYGFTVMELHRIAALVRRDNLPSLKLLQYYGFKFEGTLREDHVVEGLSEDSESYSLLSWEWKKNVLPSK